MSHGPEHQIEQAEHAAHASHDGFNKNVTMSIAIVAAVLACVTMLGHRAHNETLRLQGEALRLQTDAGIMSTSAANQWSKYQSKNSLSVQSENALDMLKFLTVQPEQKKDFTDVVDRLKGIVKYYRGAADFRISKTSKEPAGAEDKKPAGKLAILEHEGHDLVKETKKLQKEAEEKIKESHQEHVKAERLDLGELGLQFAVVLCSLAILTRNRGFWFTGIASGVVGAAISATGQFGMFMGEHH